MATCRASTRICHQAICGTHSVRHPSPYLPPPSAADNRIHAHAHTTIDSPLATPGTVHIAPLHHTTTSAVSALYHKSTYHIVLVADLYLVPRTSVALISLSSPSSSHFPRLYCHHCIPLSYDLSISPVKLMCAPCLYIPSSLGFHSLVLHPLDFEYNWLRRVMFCFARGPKGVGRVPRAFRLAENVQ